MGGVLISVFRASLDHRLSRSQSSDWPPSSLLPRPPSLPSGSSCGRYLPHATSIKLMSIMSTTLRVVRRWHWHADNSPLDDSTYTDRSHLTRLSIGVVHCSHRRLYNLYCFVLTYNTAPYCIAMFCCSTPTASDPSFSTTRYVPVSDCKPSDIQTGLW